MGRKGQRRGQVVQYRELRGQRRCERQRMATSELWPVKYDQIRRGDKKEFELIWDEWPRQTTLRTTTPIDTRRFIHLLFRHFYNRRRQKNHSSLDNIDNKLSQLRSEIYKPRHGDRSSRSIIFPWIVCGGRQRRPINPATELPFPSVNCKHLDYSQFSQTKSRPERSVPS